MGTVRPKQFEFIDKGIILLLDKTHKKEEENYSQNNKEDNKLKIYSRIPIFLLVAIVLGFGIFIRENFTNSF